MPRIGDILGYARILTADQDISGQKDRLIQNGAVRVFEDVISGKTFNRSGLAALLDHARPNNTLAVIRQTLDRPLCSSLAIGFGRIQSLGDRVVLNIGQIVVQCADGTLQHIFFFIRSRKAIRKVREENAKGTSGVVMDDCIVVHKIFSMMTFYYFSSFYVYFFFSFLSVSKFRYERTWVGAYGLG